MPIARSPIASARVFPEPAFTQTKVVLFFGKPPSVIWSKPVMFEKNGVKTKEIWIGFYKQGSGKVGITYAQALDEALGNGL